MTTDDLRAFVMTLDGAEESSHHGRPDFRYRNKIVVNLEPDQNTITIKLDLTEQAALLARSGDTFSPPPGWAKHGWTTFDLGSVDDDELRELITQAWDDTISRS